MLITVRQVRRFTTGGRSDADLLHAHIAGDRDAFAELFSRHHHHLSRVARCTSLTAEDADDALQEAMLAAHRSALSFRHDAAVSSWLHRIVVNACLDRLRRVKNQPSSLLTDTDHPVSDNTAAVETAIMVRHALMRLPVEQRAAVVAVDMHGYSIAETAAILGVAQGTVKSRCFRARARLAVLLNPLDSRSDTSHTDTSHTGDSRSADLQPSPPVGNNPP